MRTCPALCSQPQRDHRKEGRLAFKTVSNQWMLPSWRKVLTFSNSATTHSPRTEHTVCSMGSVKWFLSHYSLLEHSQLTAITHPPRETGSDKQQKTENMQDCTGTHKHTDAHTKIHKHPVNTHSDTRSQRRLDVPRNKPAFIHLDLHSLRPWTFSSRPKHTQMPGHLQSQHTQTNEWSPEKDTHARRIREEHAEIYFIPQPLTQGQRQQHANCVAWWLTADSRG